LLDHFRAERDVLHRVTPGVPVTTNFMVMHRVKNMDYWAWAPEQDIVSNDHYLDGSLPDPHVNLSFCADLTRGLAGGQPWMLMEHSSSAVNWQPRNYAKAPGQLIRNSLQHVARGADSVLFFQWRASRVGAEKFHSGLVPHAGTDTKIWRDVVELGRVLDTIGEVAGSTVRAEVALLYDWQAWWAAELDSHPTSELTYHDRMPSTALSGMSA
jgi:beta-galactosidase